MIELNEHTMEILGKVNFMCAPIAQVLRNELGYTIRTKSEDEQATVIHWLLNLYEEHGENWKSEAYKILNSKKEEMEEKKGGSHG